MKKTVAGSAMAVLALLMILAGLTPAADANRRAVLEGIVFEPGTSQFKPEAEAELQKLLAELKQTSDMTIEIQGHTVPGESPAADRALSQQRARQVKQWLVNHGINERRIITVGYGSSRPLVENSTEQGRRINERIEIVKTRTRFPVAELAETEFAFDPVPDGSTVMHEFRMQNTGEAILEISNIKTG
jgi:hypothetical protein